MSVPILEMRIINIRFIDGHITFSICMFNIICMTMYMTQYDMKQKLNEKDDFQFAVLIII